MLSVHEIEQYFHDAGTENLDIILELRNIVFSIAPQATEMIQWKGISYFDASRGGTVSAGICQIHVVDGAVRLGFIHGAFLPDPAHLLKGNRKAKRYLELRSFGDTPWNEIKALIRASAAFDPYIHFKKS